MRRRGTTWRAAVWVGLFSAVPVLAQELEGGLGLDLTDAADYRPTAAVVGLAAADAEVPAGLGERLKVDKVATELVEAADRSGAFSQVIPPAEVYGKVSEAYAEALACAELSCLQPLSEKLEVNVVLTGQLVLKGGKPTLRVVRFTRFTQALDVTEVEITGGPRDFQRKAVAAFQAAFADAPKGLALLKITGGPKGTTARIAQGSLGPVPVDLRVPGGTHTLKIEAEGFLSDEIELQLEEGRSTAVEANLVPRPAEVAAAPEPPPALDLEAQAVPTGTPLYRRPGLYLAVAGVAAAALGVSFGMQAKRTQARAVDADGDGAVDISLRERNRAYANASLANVLVGAGGAAVAGGVLWLFLTPTRAPAPTLDPDEAGVGMTFGAVGRFP